MKKQIVIFSIFFACIFSSHAQEYCDTLKWEVVKTNYGYIAGSHLHIIGDLDGAVINVDTLSLLSLEMVLVNISNDTFSSNERYQVIIDAYIYGEDSLIVMHRVIPEFSINKDFLPNDTVKVGFGSMVDLLYMINQTKLTYNIDFEQIAYWSMRIGVFYTSKDGMYSERVFLEGADTSIFYVVKTPVSIKEAESDIGIISVFPNPTQTQFTVTNTENADIYLYNILGQEVLRIYSKEENTVINVDFLPQGIYVLKVVKDGGSTVHKIMISD